MLKINKKIIILALLAIISLLITIILHNSSAKYATTNTGTATAKAATWDFKVGIGTVATQTINLATTIPTNTYNIANDVIAPGTSGEFILVLDASGCQVGVEYSVDFEGLEGEEIPAGLTISTKITGAQTGRIPYSSVASDMKIEIPVKWTWEEGTINSNGIGSDNNFQGREFENIKVTVSGTQYLE